MSNIDYETAEILIIIPEQRRRIARRWVNTVLAVQVAIFLLGATGNSSWLNFGYPGDSLLFAIAWTADTWLIIAASLIWPTSIVVAPLIVAFACLAASESRKRTLVCVAISLVLTMIPWLVIASLLSLPNPLSG